MKRALVSPDAAHCFSYPSAPPVHTAAAEGDVSDAAVILLDHDELILNMADIP